jgi:hypothetical protein
MNPVKAQGSRVPPLKIEFLTMNPVQKAAQQFIRIEEISRIADRVTISANAKAMFLKSTTRLMSDHPWQILSYEIRGPHRAPLQKDHLPTPIE